MVGGGAETHWGCCCGGRCSGCAAGRAPACAGSRVDSAAPAPSARLQQEDTNRALEAWHRQQQVALYLLPWLNVVLPRQALRSSGGLYEFSSVSSLCAKSILSCHWIRACFTSGGTKHTEFGRQLTTPGSARQQPAGRRSDLCAGGTAGWL